MGFEVVDIESRLKVPVQGPGFLGIQFVAGECFVFSGQAI